MAVVDSGASTTCAKPEEEEMQESECGGYKWKAPPHRKTGEKSNKIFSMAMEHIAPGDDVVELTLNVRGKANEAHTVSGIKKQPVQPQLAGKRRVRSIFWRNGFKVYDAINTTIWVTRGAALQGCYCPDEGLWRIPLLNRGGQAQKTATF